MGEIFYKIGEVADILGVEQHTLRYLEHTLRLKIKRDERSDRLYSESDLDTLRLILRLKTEKGLNTTAIRMALNNLGDNHETAVSPLVETTDLIQLTSSIQRIVEQNDELLEQNRLMQKRIDELENKINRRNEKTEEKIDELIRLWRKDQDDRNKSWLSKLTRK